MNYRTTATDRLMDTVASLTDREACYRFFEDVCTVAEIRDMAQRLQVARMLDEGMSYTAISRETGMSSATISRVRRALVYGAGYRAALDAEGASTKEE